MQVTGESIKRQLEQLETQLNIMKQVVAGNIEQIAGEEVCFDVYVVDDGTDPVAIITSGHDEGDIIIYHVKQYEVLEYGTKDNERMWDCIENMMEQLNGIEHDMDVWRMCEKGMDGAK